MQTNVANEGCCDVVVSASKRMLTRVDQHYKTYKEHKKSWEH